MKHLIAKVLILFATLFCFNNAIANHIVGMEIRYKSVGIRQYEVSLKMYRECSGIQMCGACSAGPTPTGCAQDITVAGVAAPTGLPHNLPSQTCNTTNFGTFSLPIATGVNAFDVMQLCNLTKSTCTNCNTRAAGTFAPGIEVYNFKGTLNLSFIPASCCWVSIGTANSLCCRNSAITTIANPSATGIFADAKLNICLSTANESPVFMNESEPIIPSGADAFVNLGAYDPDGDSISFRLGSIEASRGVSVPFSVPYSQGAPFPYLGIPGTSPPLLPPQGINLDPVSGLIRFRPMGLFAAVLSIEVLEWRKINNVTTLIGITKRDLQLYSQFINNTNKPGIRVYYNGSITNANTINVCNENQVCFNVISPSSGWTGNDTTDLEISFGSNNATATITRPYNTSTRSINGPKYDTLSICISGLNNNTNFANKPYLLHIKAKNRLCPINTSIIRSIVINKLSLSSNISMVKQSKFYGLPIYARINLNGNTGFIKDSTQWFVESSPGSNNFIFAGAGSDTLNNTYTLNQGGWHKIRASLYSTTCERVTISDSVFGKFMMIDVLKINPEKCLGDSNGQVILRRLGGVGSTRVSLQKTTPGTPFFIPLAEVDTFNRLPKDNYLIRIVDSLNNRDSIQVTINRNSTPYIANAASLVHINCFGDSTGSAVLNFTGGDSLGLRYYSYDSLNWQLSNVFTKLTAGAYRFLVKDSSNCRGSQNLSINQSPQLVVNSFVVQPIKCKGDSNATVLIQTTGGSWPYQAKFEQGNYASTFTFSNLKANNYQITVRDNKGCLKPINAIVSEPNTKFAGNVELVQPLCHLQPGNAQVFVSGGTAPYQYWLSGNSPDNSSIFNAISAGNKIIYARDSNQCLLSFNITINNPPALSFQHKKTDINCNADTNGSITFIPTGGTKPYQYKINNKAYQSDSIFLNLGSGTYTLSLRDSGACVQNAQTIITSRTPILNTISTSNESCLGAKDGTATTNISGGVSPYSIIWQTNPPINGNKATGLGNGKYYLQVTDSLNCSKTDSFNINFNPPYAGEVICGTSFIEDTKKVSIVWNKTLGKTTGAYKLFYQYDVNGTATELASVPITATSSIIDSVSNKDGVVFYRISAIDTCGNPSAMSNPIATPLLSINKSGNLINLSWNSQNLAPEITGFQIYKGINNNPFSLLSSVALPQNTYTDSLTSTGSLKYYLEAIGSLNCGANFKIKSNLVQNIANGVGDINFKNLDFLLFPNPAENWVEVRSIYKQSFNQIKVFSMQGQLLLIHNLQNPSYEKSLDIYGFANGVYQVQILSENNIIRTLPLVVNDNP